MNKLLNKFLLAGYKVMPVINSKQHEFRYSACAPFIKDKERMSKLKEI